MKEFLHRSNKKYFEIISNREDSDSIINGYCTKQNKKNGDEITDILYQRYANYIKPLNGMSILDAGCGSGAFGKYFLNYFRDYKLKYIGVDFAQGMVEKAQKNIKNYDIFKMDISNLKFENDSFDVVYSIFTFINFKTKQYRIKVLDELVRVSKKYVILTNIPVNLKLNSLDKVKILVASMIGKTGVGTMPYTSDFFIEYSRKNNLDLTILYFDSFKNKIDVILKKDIVK